MSALPTVSAASALANIGAGFADAIHGSQQTFRVLLDAMSRPGRLHRLPAAATAGLDSAPAGMAPPAGIGMAAGLLTLLDADTPVLLAGVMADERTRAWIRFHTGARLAAPGDPAGIAACLCGDVTPALWEVLALGSDEVPQDGATLLVEVDALFDRSTHGGADEDAAKTVGGFCDTTTDAVALTLRGPGIETTQRLVVAGLPDAFWRWRQTLQAALPRGVDLVLIHGSTLAAIPRSSHIERGA